MALIPVDPVDLATIVTTLEMAARPPLRPLPASHLRLVDWRAPDPACCSNASAARGYGIRGWPWTMPR